MTLAQVEELQINSHNTHGRGNGLSSLQDEVTQQKFAESPNARGRNLGEHLRFRKLVSQKYCSRR